MKICPGAIVGAGGVIQILMNGASVLPLLIMKQKEIKASQSLRSGPLLSFGKCGKLFNLGLLTVLHLFLLIQT